MDNTLIDVRAPGCAGDYFYGYCDCPECGAPIAFTLSTGFKVVCACGQPVTLGFPRQG
jgi:hypothetical protein